jgi:hypothetical protein
VEYPSEEFMGLLVLYGLTRSITDLIFGAQFDEQSRNDVFEVSSKIFLGVVNYAASTVCVIGCTLYMVVRTLYLGVRAADVLIETLNHRLLHDPLGFFLA